MMLLTLTYRITQRRTRKSIRSGDAIIFQIKSMAYQINVRRNRRWRPPSETEVQVLLLLVGSMLLLLVPTPTLRLMLLLLLLHKQTKKACNGRNHNNKYVYISMGLLPVIFNTNTILLTKSISSLSKSKSNNCKKSDKEYEKDT